MALPASSKLGPGQLDNQADTSPHKAITTTTTDLESASNNAHGASQSLARGLSTRQVSMIALGGTIGSGLFLGTGKSLATGGPASLLIAYAIVGAVIYLTMLALGEMAAYMPISGSFGVYATRFINAPAGFAIQWNYWANDAISTAADLVALQLIIQYWNENAPSWAVSLGAWVALILVNSVGVAVYGEVEYWLSLLKIVTIVVFIILGICVNAGANSGYGYIGAQYWHIPGAPFVGGIGGFASVFVTASFAYGGTESIGITAGETKDPAKTMPKAVRNVFYRVLLFYILALLIVGLNVPWNYPGLSSKTTATSPFTIVFKMTGSQAAGSFMNAVILTALLSGANHALYAGTRLLYSLAHVGQAPKVFGITWKRFHVPWVALLATASISILCFGSSYIGAGELWTWLQNLVGVSNQLAWVTIGIASIRFNRAIKAQGKLHRLPYRNWTQPWGPWIVVLGSSFMVLVQGWSSFAPWDVSDFFSYYVELPIMLLFYLAWCVVQRRWFALVALDAMNLDTDTLVDRAVLEQPVTGKLPAALSDPRREPPRWRRAASSIVSWVF